MPGLEKSSKGKPDTSVTGIEWILDSIARTVLAPAIRRIWVERIEGIENLPGAGACIIAANRQSRLDLLCCNAALPRRIHYAVSEIFLSDPAWKWVMRASGQIRPTRFDLEDAKPDKTLLTVLKQGMALGIVSETIYYGFGKVSGGETAIARLALKARVPVVPVAILPGASKKMTIRIGKPMDLSRFFWVSGSHVIYDWIAGWILYEIERLTGDDDIAHA